MSVTEEEAVPAGTAAILAAGLSYRQVDYAVRRGWLRPVGGHGSGRVRGWPPQEIAIAARMARLIAAGIGPEQAHEFAREHWPKGEIAPGIGIEVTEGNDE